MSRLSSTNRGSSLATGAPVWHKFRLGFCSVTEYGCPVRQALGMEFVFCAQVFAAQAKLSADLEDSRLRSSSLIDRGKAQKTVSRCLRFRQNEE